LAKRSPCNIVWIFKGRQDGGHPGEMSIAVKKLKGLDSEMIHQLRGE